MQAAPYHRSISKTHPLYLRVAKCFAQFHAIAVFLPEQMVSAPDVTRWLYHPKNEKLADLTPREVATFVPLLVLAFWIGLYPKPFFQILEQPVNHTIAVVRPDYPQPASAVNAAAQTRATSNEAEVASTPSMKGKN